MPACVKCGSRLERGDAFCPACGSARPPAPARPSQNDGTGFWGQVFDLSFQDLITPRIIQTIFVAGLILYGLAALGYLVFVLSMSRHVGGAAVMVGLVGIILGFLVAVVLLRISLEVLIVIFKIAADLKAIRRFQEEAAAPQAEGQSGP